jgi:GTP-binding protein
LNVELAHDATDARGFPMDGLPEVALLGRSNVGKSSLLNRLVGRRRLARTSATPGKTRRIQFYRIESRGYLADLPGYGYARVSREDRKVWAGLVESYLRGSRPPLRGALLLIDARRAFSDDERDLLRWLATERIPARIVLTKADKLTRRELAASQARLLRAAALPADAAAAVSAKTGAGIGALATWIDAWLGVTLRTADGRALAPAAAAATERTSLASSAREAAPSHGDAPEHPSAAPEASGAADASGEAEAAHAAKRPNAR